MLTIEERGDAVVVVHIDHGKVNALDVELLGALADAFEAAGAGDRAVVVTGNGRVFSAGVDLRRVLDGGPAYADALVPALHRAFMAIFTCPRPVVAAVDGAAIAGGCIIAAACDQRLMADGPGGIGTTELVVGVPFPVAPLEIMTHACGPLAGDLVLRAPVLSAAEAAAAGFVHRLVAPGDLLAAATTLAGELAALPAAAYALAKQRLRAPAVERIERDAPATDVGVAAAWGAPETARRISEQLARIAAARS